VQRGTAWILAACSHWSIYSTRRSAIGHCTVKSRVDWTKTGHVTFWCLTDVTLSWLEVGSLNIKHIQLYWSCQFSKAERILLVFLSSVSKFTNSDCGFVMSVRLSVCMERLGCH
jgi:hypothetical protein